MHFIQMKQRLKFTVLIPQILGTVMKPQVITKMASPAIFL